ncbi:pentapeptide repeat-containing protein [Piscirickettsia salmonis]|uniref:pentapeptide repeat-containing protein n=1 Tax=Piscirickettsia salmonis TaxID=1238 RepID=UPI0007C965BF|nr:Pentapeptide repeats (8 copies) [Piscirickettsiaceae bacterium NZ-RLO1]
MPGSAGDEVILGERTEGNCEDDRDVRRGFIDKFRAKDKPRGYDDPEYRKKLTHLFDKREEFMAVLEEAARNGRMANFSGWTFDEGFVASLQGMVPNIERACFDGAKFNCANMRWIKCKDVTFRNATFHKVRFDCAELENASFAGATLDNVNFSYMKVKGKVDFNGAIFSGDIVFDESNFDQRQLSPEQREHVCIKADHLIARAERAHVRAKNAMPFLKKHLEQVPEDEAPFINDFLRLYKEERGWRLVKSRVQKYMDEHGGITIEAIIKLADEGEPDCAAQRALARVDRDYGLQSSGLEPSR